MEKASLIPAIRIFNMEASFSKAVKFSAIIMLNYLLIDYLS
jgi:hypothetical protein